MRGNQCEITVERADVGSIPACAGEPIAAVFQKGLIGVYPRVCGGTPASPDHPFEAKGLSPRVRGNLCRCRRVGCLRRSIPACAGEPARRSIRCLPGKVYPRVCGGTHPSLFDLLTDPGLSPRVRGNPLFSRLRAGRRGSIPACAGEPSADAPTRPAPAVYPRVCGGTFPDERGRGFQKGLSPRVRGNRPNASVFCRRGRSIPACAGEPAFDRGTGPSEKVYPRVCGGTDAESLLLKNEEGLSPRVRGNRIDLRIAAAVDGSIPACAGEPLERVS